MTGQDPGRVVVLGSVNRDLVLSVDRHPDAGETVAATGFSEHPGGKGANQAVAAARAGARTMLAGAIGDDGFGRAMRDFLAGEEIDLAHLRVIAGTATGVASIAVDRGGENVIIVAPGANLALKAADAQAIPLRPGDHVVAQFEVPVDFIRAGFARAKAAGATTILNPAPMKPLAADILALTDILIVNETEFAQSLGTGIEALTSADAVAHAAAGLRARPDQIIIVTLGAEGVIAIGPEGPIQMHGFPVTPVDTTGAGDCFVGVLAASLVEGMPLRRAIGRANRAAAISVTRHGAASSLPRRVEIG